MARFRTILSFLGFIEFVIFVYGFELERYYIPTQEHFVAQQSQAVFQQHNSPDVPFFGFPSHGHGTASASASSASTSAFSFGLGNVGLNNQFFGGAFGLGFGFGGGWYPSPLIPDIGQGRPSDVIVPTLLKPSDSGWDTSYSYVVDVPCGSYKIRPFVIANLRLGTSSSPFLGRRRKRSTPGFENESKQSERSNFPFFPIREPRSCSWDFNSDGPCKLKFKCVWFQLPALFSCTENYLLVSDSTNKLNNTFCGNRKPRKIYNSSSGKLILTFRSQTSSLPAVFDCAVTCTLDVQGSTEPADDKPHSSLKLVQTQVKDTQTNSSIAPNLKEKPRMRIGDCRCGVQDGHYSTRGRIVGGTTTLPSEFPWVAALVKKSSSTSRFPQPFCAGSLISDRYVLTAAHCVLNNKIIREPRSIPGGSSSMSSLRNPKDLFDVLLIEHDINHLDEVPGGTIRATVDKIIVHPDYDNVTFHFDVALLRLEKPIDFSSDFPNYQYNQDNGFNFDSERRRRLLTDIEARSSPRRPTPICLPLDSDLSLEDNYGIITGWGLQTEGGIPSEKLMKATVQIFNDTICKELYKEYNYPVTESMMCAGYLKGKIDSCVGDSGGGLAILQSDRHYLAGITSWGRGCGRKKQPGIYTKTQSPGLIEWIRSEASDGVWCV